MALMLWLALDSIHDVPNAARAPETSTSRLVTKTRQKKAKNEQ